MNSSEDKQKEDIQWGPLKKFIVLKNAQPSCGGGSTEGADLSHPITNRFLLQCPLWKQIEG